MQKSRLTPRETEILTWLSVGKTAWEISVILSISHRTVEFHIANIINNLVASNSRHAVAIAAAEGIVTP
jgi:DNA-binding CsgD family transcriptional regulator